MKSIMHKKDGTCYLCMKLHNDYSEKVIEEHHVVFGNANRKLAEKFGLKVYLDHEHHRTGPESAHMNHEIARLLQQDAQKAFQREFPDLDFKAIFGKNYILDEDAAGYEEHGPAFEINNGFKLIGDLPNVDD